MKKILFLLSSLLLAGVLAGCNLGNVFPTVDINVSLVDNSKVIPDFNDTQIRIQTEGTGFLIEEVRFMASSRAGSMGVDINSFSIDYFTADGQQLPTGTGESYRGSVSLRVPAGFNCPDIEDDGTGSSSGECGFLTEGSVAASSDIVFSPSFYAIDIDIISVLAAEQFAILNADGSVRELVDIEREGAYASIVLDGVDANGNAFSKRLAPVTIVFVNE